MSGKEIRALRESIGLLPIDLAGLLGINRARIYEWESQAKVPDRPNETLLDLLMRQRDTWVDLGGTADGYGRLLLLQGKIPETLPDPESVTIPRPQTPWRGDVPSPNRR